MTCNKKGAKNPPAPDMTLAQMFEKNKPEIRRIANAYGDDLMNYGATMVKEGGKYVPAVRFTFNTHSDVKVALPKEIGGMRVVHNARTSMLPSKKTISFG